MFLKNINVLRSVDWGSTHLWDITFNDSELNTFEKWFPASNVEEGMFSSNSHTFEACGSNFAVPKSQGLDTIKVTFIDSVGLEVHEWLKDWVKKGIYNNGRYVSRLKDPNVLKTLTIRRVDHKHVELPTKIGLGSYQVYPQGEFHFTGDSEGNPVSNTVEFVIVSETPKV